MVILKVILKVIKLKKNLLVRKMEAARGMLKQPKSRSETERLIMKMAVVFLTWKMIKILLLLIMTMIMMRLKNRVIIVVMMIRRGDRDGCGEQGRVREQVTGDHSIVVPLPQVLLLIIGYLVVFFDQSDQSIANLAVNIYHLVSLYLATNSDGSIFCLSFCIPPDILHDTDTFSPIHHQPIPFYRT